MASRKRSLKLNLWTFLIIWIWKVMRRVMMRRMKVQLKIYRFLDESHMDIRGTIRSGTLLSAERREVMVGFLTTIITTKKLQIHLCIKIPTYQMQARQEVSITTLSFASFSCTLWTMLSHVFQVIRPNLGWNLLI